MRSILAQYRLWLDKRPITTKAITCGLIFSIADYIAQKMEVQERKPWDQQRTCNFVTVGIIYYGPSLHFWYCKILPVLANFLFKGKSKMKIVSGSVVLDQFLFTPIFYCGYYMIDSIVELKSIKKGIVQGTTKIRQKMIQTLIADTLLWPLATGINLWYVPIHFQVLFNNIICLFWDVILCHITKK